MNHDNFWINGPVKVLDTTLLLLGKLDFAIPYEAWEVVMEGNDNVRYILMENASHNPQTEPSTAADFSRHFLAWRSGKQSFH